MMEKHEPSVYEKFRQSRPVERRKRRPASLGRRPLPYPTARRRPRPVGMEEALTLMAWYHEYGEAETLAIDFRRSLHAIYRIVGHQAPRRARRPLALGRAFHPLRFPSLSDSDIEDPFYDDPFGNP